MDRPADEVRESVGEVPTGSARPPLNDVLSADEFSRWYWRKDELVPFARTLGVSTSGSKPDIAERIRAILNGHAPTPPVKRRAIGSMPTHFTLNTVIETGWRCNPSLGAFFRKQCGTQFRFNGAMRDFIHTAVGQTLRDAVACYEASVAPDAVPQPMLPQNEYNKHTREYFVTHPNGTHAEAREAWRLYREKRRVT